MTRRLELGPAPAPDDVAGRTVHEVIRDYPEALTALRRLGVDVAAEGGRPLREVRGREDVVRAVVEATAWRPDPPTTPSTGTTGGAEGEAMGGRGGRPQGRRS